MSRYARRIGIALLALAVLAAGGAIGAGLWLQHQISAIPRIPTSQFTSSGPGATAGPTPDGQITSWVIASTGSKNMTAAQAAKYGIAGMNARGEDGLTDTLLDVVVDPATSQAAVLSIPRDTWVPDCATAGGTTGPGCKINALLNTHGVQRLTDEVAYRTGIGVDHVVLLNFAAFGEVTDALGGIDLDVTRPLRDTYSGLSVSPGCQHFDGRTALELVRSRHTETLRSGRWVTDVSATDFGRIARQQVYLQAVKNALLTPSAVLKAPGLLAAAKNDLTLDAGVGDSQLLGLAKAFAAAGGGRLATFSLPGHGGWAGAASVVYEDTAAAPGVLQAFRAAGGLPPATSGPAAATPAATPTPTGPGTPASSATGSTGSTGPTGVGSTGTGPTSSATSSADTAPPTTPDAGVTPCA